MKYDQIELMKLNLTEDSIQAARDHLLKCLTEYNTLRVITYIDKVYLPFVIDMLDGYEFTYTKEGELLIML